MVPSLARLGGRRWRYAISDNCTHSAAVAHALAGPLPPKRATSTPASFEPEDGGLWAVNIHGFFAGGGMYWRESARLAQRLGWRVINPSLPGFGGSDCLDWNDLSMSGLARGVARLLDHIGVETAVILGHSMGGAVAVQFASDFPDRTLGVIYRDGAATPAWRRRHGPVARLLAPVAPEIAPLADLLSAGIIDLPDLLVGRLTSTVKSLLPDLQRNVRALGRTLPVAALLSATGLCSQTMALGEDGSIPILTVWGCFDRIAHPGTAEEFAALSRTEVLWILGGHSWMLARPETQASLLKHHPKGVAFLEKVGARLQIDTSINKSVS